MNYLSALRQRSAVWAVAVGVAMFGAGGAVAQAPLVGSTMANPAVLARLFVNVCVNAPNRADAEAMLVGLAMAVNPSTGTYFHPEFDMSINPAGARCSIVFGSNRSTADAMAAFSASVAQVMGAQGQNVDVEPVTTGDTTYIRAGIGVQW